MDSKEQESEAVKVASGIQGVTSVMDGLSIQTTDAE
jgi:osmotically-inducible protein OsmY